MVNPIPACIGKRGALVFWGMAIPSSSETFGSSRWIRAAQGAVPSPCHFDRRHDQWTRRRRSCFRISVFVRSVTCDKSENIRKIADGCQSVAKWYTCCKIIHKFVSFCTRRVEVYAILNLWLPFFSYQSHWNPLIYRAFQDLREFSRILDKLAR